MTYCFPFSWVFFYLQSYLQQFDLLFETTYIKKSSNKHHITHVKITLVKRCHHKPSGDIIFHVINNKLHNVFYLVVSCNSNAYLFTNQYESRANKLIEMYSNYFKNWNTNICFEFDQQMRVVCVLAREKKYANVSFTEGLFFFEMLLANVESTIYFVLIHS